MDGREEGGEESPFMPACEHDPRDTHLEATCLNYLASTASRARPRQRRGALGGGREGDGGGEGNDGGRRDGDGEE